MRLNGKSGTAPGPNRDTRAAGLGRLSARELVAAAGRAEAASRALSAELVAQLARRDELAFEKEVKTAFIGALLAVQGEQREQREAARRRRRDRGLSLQGGRPERGNHMPRKVGNGGLGAVGMGLEGEMGCGMGGCGGTGGCGRTGVGGQGMGQRDVGWGHGAGG